MKKALGLILITISTVVYAAQAVPGDALAKGIQYSDFRALGNRLRVQDGADDFPYAKSCSCNLTDSCSVSCASTQVADCRPYQVGAALYCQCQCL